MIRVLKQGVSEVDAQTADRSVKATVEAILDDVAARGEAAVRELSTRLDKWSPQNFRLAPSEIDALIASLPEQTVTDIRFAQAQIRKFAEAQLSTIRDIDIETIPGVRLGQKLCPWGALSDGGLCPHERIDREGRRREAGYRLHAAARRQAACRDDRRNGDGGRR
jgi:histidinol dehydrogenase